jgi:POT family proton-dependent oligopeptide transporter
MGRREYLTAPLPTDKMPAGMPYIFVNEAAERFAFYGMTSILVVFMTSFLRGPGGALSDEQATEWFHWFNFGVYFLPFLGALLSDIWLAKYRTIIYFSLVYCVGLIAVTVDDTRLGLVLSLVLTALGSGIIKPCVAANVGDQFGSRNKHLLSKFYGWFYFAINVGAALSMFLCPWLLHRSGPFAGFGLPAALMILATVAYWAGRRKLVHVPPAGARFVRETFSRTGLAAVGKLSIIYAFIIMFWALYNQSQSAWVLQARNMNLRWLGITWLPEWPQAINAVLVMVMIPLFSYAVYPGVEKVMTLRPLRKIAIGLFVTALSFVVSAWIEIRIAAGFKPSLGWQCLAYVFLTAAEILVSITALEFSYTQAPKEMKSLVQAVFLLSISLGNAFTAVVNWFIRNADGTSKLSGPGYYWFFVVAMLVTSVLFLPVARWYRPKDYLQDEAPAPTPAESPTPSAASGPSA